MNTNLYPSMLLMEWYDRETERMIGEAELSLFSEEEIGQILRFGEGDNLAAGSYPVPADLVAIFTNRQSLPDLSATYDYFVGKVAIISARQD